jgi:molybdate transport system substrate-binding protein
MAASEDEGTVGFRAVDNRLRDREGPRAQASGRPATGAAQSDTALHVLSAGAAQGIVGALAPAFSSATNADIRASFGAVGAIKSKLLAGEPCDVVILTAALIEELVYGGQVRAGTARELGRVHTGVAVCTGDRVPDVASSDALREALCAASSIYVPDMQQSTAGRHVARMLKSLGISDDVASRLRMFPNGATAMRSLAGEGDDRSMGITQVTEILYTEGVSLVRSLPAEFELATVYSAAISSGARHAAAAGEFIAMLSGAESGALRHKAGFEA